MTPRDESSKDGFARDHNGELILDRFGRPVRRRSTLPPPEGKPSSRQDDRPRPEPPQYRRQQLPPTAPPEPRSPQGHHPHGARSMGNQPRGYPSQEHPDWPEHQQPPSYQAPRAEPGYQEPPRASYRSPYQERPTGSPSFGASSRRSRPGDRGGSFGRRRRDARPPRRPRLLPRFGIFKTILALILVFILVMVGGLFWVDSKLNRVEALKNYSGRVGNTKGTNWLLVGSDSRAGLDKKDADRLMAGEINDSVGRTDTIMIVHVPSIGGKPTMLSLPRDSWVDIPGQGQNKLNQAFSIGGPALLQQTVEKATGLRIDRYAEIGFGGFANVVDSVGGLEMCLKEPLKDPMAGIDLKAGCQKMNGPTALGYVRSRYTSARGDLDRVDRQKEFLSALSKKVASPGTMLNPFRGFPTAKSLAGSLTVNKKDHAWNLAMLGLAMRGGANQETVPIGSYMDTYAGNVAVWDDQAAQAIFNKLK